MLEKILKTMQRGELSLQPFAVMADGSEKTFNYTSSINEKRKPQPWPLMTESSVTIYSLPIPVMSCNAAVLLRISPVRLSASRSWASVLPALLLVRIPETIFTIITKHPSFT